MHTDYIATSTRQTTAWVLTGIMACSLIATVNAGEDESGRAITSGEIVYEQIAPFVKMGGAWGNRAEGAHGTFGEFPGGASSPAHTHSDAYHGVVISGVMANPFNNEPDPVKMGPGGYWYVPAGVEHITACLSDEPCLFYFHADSAFDFTPVGN
jgi:quercetin dioxygenase-like cupin family protein